MEDLPKVAEIVFHQFGVEVVGGGLGNLLLEVIVANLKGLLAGLSRLKLTFQAINGERAFAEGLHKAVDLGLQLGQAGFHFGGFLL